MEKKNYKLYHGETLMPWGKGSVVQGAKGLVFVAGCEGQDPTQNMFKGGRIVAGADAQMRLALQKMKERLEEMGTTMENIVHMTIYIVGPFPEGVAYSPNYRRDVLHQFFKENCPEMAFDKNPPPFDLVGVAGLAHKDMLVEVGCIAVLPD